MNKFIEVYVQMKINLKIVLYFLFVLIPFQSFVIPFSNSIYFSVFSIFTVLLFLILFINNYKKFIKLFVFLSRNQLFKSFNYLIFFILLTSLINIILGNYRISLFYYLHHFRELLFSVYLVYILPVLALFYGISFKQILKYLVVMIWIILILGLIGYISSIFEFSIGQNILYFFSNKFLLQSYTGTNIRLWDSCNRAYSVFSEPSEFAQFIFIILPLAYSIVISKLKIFKRNIFNIINNDFLIMVIWLNLILTKSPIFLILCCIITIFYFKSSLASFFKKHIWGALLVIFLIILIIYTFFFITFSSLEQSYLYRIIKTIMAFGSFENFVELEPSLATRIVAYYHSLLIFKKNMVIGTGFYNAGAYFYNSYTSSNILLTNENLYKAFMNPYNVPFSRGLIYTLLAEGGIFTFFCYVLFLIKNLKFLSFRLKKQSYKYNLFYGMYISTFSIIINSFYNLYFERSVVWLLFGMILSVSYFKNKGKRI